MQQKCYLLKKTSLEFLNINDSDHWQGIEPININYYISAKNDYQLPIIIKGCYSKEYIYINFLVFEKK